MKNVRLSHLDRWQRGQLNINKRTWLQWSVILLAFWPFLFKPVSSLPGVIGYLKYLPDAFLMTILMLRLGKKHLVLRKTIIPLFSIVITLLFYTMLIYLFRYQSIAYYLWGFRNNFRFYIAFFAFISYLDETDVATWVKVLDMLFWVNAVLSLFQFVFLGIRQDFLGGIFGIQGASNGFTLCFMSIVLGKTLLQTFNGEEKLTFCIVKVTVAVVIAAMAELKFFFFVVIFLMIGATMLTRFSVKKMLCMMLGLLVLMIGADMLVETFGLEKFFSLEGLWEKALSENYASANDINRLSAIPTLSKRILTNPLQQLFGLGLGNCDTSSFAICNTPFYRQYGYLHYTWFASAMVFLEMGYVGLVLYTSFYVVCFIQTYKRYKANSPKILYHQLAMLMTVLSVILTIYNSTMRIEAGYMMYFVMAIPFIQKKNVS